MTAARIDFLNPTDRSELMRRVKSTRTGPELALIQALRKQLLLRKFEVNCEDLPGKPDVVFRSQRIAVFVDGDFWHAGQWHRRGLNSLHEQFPDSSKRARWVTKIQGNRERDLRTTSQLLDDKWKVLRFWATDVEKDANKVAAFIFGVVSGSIATSPASHIPRREVAEFFAGIGLARLGLRPANWTVCFANDNAPDKILFYKHNSPPGSQLDERDIHGITAADIPTVALATACFPCTDLSLAGAQRGLEPGTESSAYLKFTEILTQMGDRRPPFVLLENVLGMMHSRGGTDFEICLERLGNAGYTVDPFVLDAKWFVPQSRPRLFVVAIRDDLQTPRHFHGELAVVSALRPQRLIEFIKAHHDLPWSLRNLPSPTSDAPALARLLEKLPDSDPRWWSAARTSRLYDQMSARHRAIVRSWRREAKCYYGTVFRRMRNGRSMAELRTDGLAGCLRTPKGGSARQTLFRVSNGKYAARLLTPRECARLMGADDIDIPEQLSLNKALFAFGDGVCVPVIRWIAENYLTPIATELIRGRLLA